jgi:hypothetical protein
MVNLLIRTYLYLEKFLEVIQTYIKKGVEKNDPTRPTKNVYNCYLKVNIFNKNN